MAECLSREVTKLSPILPHGTTVAVDLAQGMPCLTSTENGLTVSSFARNTTSSPTPLTDYPFVTTTDFQLPRQLQHNIEPEPNPNAAIHHGNDGPQLYFIRSHKDHSGTASDDLPLSRDYNDINNNIIQRVDKSSALYTTKKRRRHNPRHHKRSRDVAFSASRHASLNKLMRLATGMQREVPGSEREIAFGQWIDNWADPFSHPCRFTPSLPIIFEEEEDTTFLRSISIGYL